MLRISNYAQNFKLCSEFQIMLRTSESSGAYIISTYITVKHQMFGPELNSYFWKNAGIFLVREFSGPSTICILIFLYFDILYLYSVVFYSRVAPGPIDSIANISVILVISNLGGTYITYTSGV